MTHSVKPILDKPARSLVPASAGLPPQAGLYPLLTSLASVQHEPPVPVGVPRASSHPAAHRLRASPQSPALVARTGSGDSRAAFAGRPGSRSAGARPIPASTAQARKADR